MAELSAIQFSKCHFVNNFNAKELNEPNLLCERQCGNCIMSSGRDVSQGAVRAKELTIQQVDVREMISSNPKS